MTFLNTGPHLNYYQYCNGALNAIVDLDGRMLVTLDGSERVFNYFLIRGDHKKFGYFLLCDYK